MRWELLILAAIVGLAAATYFSIFFHGIFLAAKGAKHKRTEKKEEIGHYVKDDDRKHEKGHTCTVEIRIYYDHEAERKKTGEEKGGDCPSWAETRHALETDDKERDGQGARTEH